MTKTLHAIEEAFISVDKEKENIGQGEGDKTIALRGGGSLGS